MTRKSNTKKLRDFYNSYAKTDVKQIVNNIIDYYEEGKIINISTAKNYLDDITSSNKATREKGLKNFKKMKDTYDNKVSIVGKLTRETAMITDEIKDYHIEYVSWKQISKEDYDKIDKKNQKQKLFKFNKYWTRLNMKNTSLTVKAPSSFLVQCVKNILTKEQNLNYIKR